MFLFSLLSFLRKPGNMFNLSKTELKKLFQGNGMLQEVARSHNTEHFKCGKVFNTNEKRCTPGSVYPKRIYAAWGTPFLPLFLKKLLMHMKYLLMHVFFMLMHYKIFVDAL